MKLLNIIFIFIFLITLASAITPSQFDRTKPTNYSIIQTNSSLFWGDYLWSDWNLNNFWKSDGTGTAFGNWGLGTYNLSTFGWLKPYYLSVTNYIIMDTPAEATATVKDIAENSGDYFLWFNVSNNIPTYSNSDKYYLVVTSGYVKGAVSIVSQLGPSGGPYGQGALKIHNTGVAKLMNEGDTIEIKLQSQTTEHLAKIYSEEEIFGESLGANILFTNIIKGNDGTKTQNAQPLIIQGGDGATYYSGSGKADAQKVIIKTNTGGDYATDIGDSGDFIIDLSDALNMGYTGGKGGSGIIEIGKGSDGTPILGTDGNLSIGSKDTGYNIFYRNLTTIIKEIITENIWLKSIQKIYFGNSKEASIYYDGNNLIINPKEVGTGNVKVEGTIDVPVYWKSYQGSFRSSSIAINHFGSANFVYGTNLSKSTANTAIITNYYIPEDAIENTTVQIMFDFLGLTDATAGNDTLRLRIGSGGITKNNGDVTLISLNYQNLNLTKIGFEKNKYMNYNIANITNLNAGDYFSVIIYRYGTNIVDTYPSDILGGYISRIKYQSTKP